MGVRVLLIEDDETIAEPLADGLRHFGLTVHHVATGADGLRGPHGDVVLLDLGLPDMDGIDVCRGIRRSSDVPIIILSARGEEADRVLGLELGADDYLAKPFSIRELVARIRAVSRRHQQRPAPDAMTDPFAQRGLGTQEFTVRGEVVSSATSGPGVGAGAGAGAGVGASPEYDWSAAYETPAHGMPTQGSPAPGAPPRETPAHGTPALGDPSVGGTAPEDTPAHGFPEFGGPAQGTADFGAPARNASAFGTSPHDTPGFGTPPHGTPAYGTPPHGTPTHGTPPHGTPAHGGPPFGNPPLGNAPFGAAPFGTPPHGTPVYEPPMYEQAPPEPRAPSGSAPADDGAPPPGPLVVDRRTRQVWVGDAPVALTPKEFELLALLTEDPGAVYSRQQILNRVWDDHYQGPTKTLDVHVATLRRKLGDPAWIQTLRGVGFRLAVRAPGPGRGRGPGDGPGRHHTPEAAAS